MSSHQGAGENREDLYDSIISAELSVIDSWDSKSLATKLGKFKSSDNHTKSPARFSKSPIRSSPKRYNRSPIRFSSRRSRSPRTYNSSPRRSSRSPRRYSRSPTHSYRRHNSLEQYSSQERRQRSLSREHQRDIRHNADVREKYVKDAKKQIIFEKIKVAESGLVPPGMETDFDMAALCTPNKSDGIDDNRKIRFSPPNRFGRFSPPDHLAMEREKEIQKKEEKLSHDNRSRVKSPFQGRFSPPPRRRSFSPPPRKRSRSPARRSPIRKKSFLEEIEEKLLQKEKKSFLTEINETLKAQQSKPLPSLFPTPLPSYTQPPSLIPQLNITTPVLRQENINPFLNMQPPMNQPNVAQGQSSFLQPGFQQLVQQRMPILIQHAPQPVPMPLFPITRTPHMPNNQVNLPPNKTQSKKEPAIKLQLADKKITLSESLQHATPNVSDNGVNIQNKINVIARCHKASNLLSREDTKGATSFTRFVVKKNKQFGDRPSETNPGVTPFKKNRAVKFQYTSMQGAQDIQIMAICLNRFIMKLDKKALFDVVGSTVGEDVIIDVDKKTHTTSKDKEKPPVFELPPKPKVLPKEPATVSKPILKITVTKGTQTNDLKCENCEARKKIRKSNSYIQTEEILSFDISCQANIEDVQKPVRSILKNQSLSTLSSSQLLLDEDDFYPKRPRYSDSMQTEINPYESSRSNLKPTINSNNFDIEPFEKYRSEPDRYDEIMSSNSNKLYDRERPVTSRSFMSKSLPFSNFDPSLSLDLQKPSYSSFRPGLSKNLPSSNTDPWTRKYETYK